MFWPTDKALNALPASRQQWLFSPDHQQELASIVKAHIIRSTRVWGWKEERKEQKEEANNILLLLKSLSHKCHSTRKLCWMSRSDAYVEEHFHLNAFSCSLRVIWVWMDDTLLIDNMTAQGNKPNCTVLAETFTSLLLTLLVTVVKQARVQHHK